jgi:hypothetical protein
MFSSIVQRTVQCLINVIGSVLCLNIIFYLKFTKHKNIMIIITMEKGDDRVKKHNSIVMPLSK